MKVKAHQVLLSIAFGSSDGFTDCVASGVAKSCGPFAGSQQHQRREGEDATTSGDLRVPPNTEDLFMELRSAGTSNNHNQQKKRGRQRGLHKCIKREMLSRAIEKEESLPRES